MIERAPEIWLFQRKGTPRLIAAATGRICQRRGWRLEQYTTMSQSLFHKGRNIRTPVLDSQQATKLYIRIHRRQVGIVYSDDTHVPVTPNPSSSIKDYVALHEFVRYKAFCRRIDPSCFNEQQAELMAAEMDRRVALDNKCEGENDPRCLPFHIFRQKKTDYDLDIQSDRQRFNKHHGSQSSRRDDNELLWDRPSGSRMHGGQALQVAGRSLVAGFHWDVSVAPKSKGTKMVSNTKAIWKIERNGHINIYPDEYIRGGKRSFQIRSNERIRRKK